MVPIMILVTPLCASHDELVILIILNDRVTLLVVISLQVPKLLYLHVADSIAARIDPDLSDLISTNENFSTSNSEPTNPH